VNTLYLHNESSFLYRPEPNVTVDTNEGKNGQQTTTSTRKDITYRLGYGTPVPWWLVDSLTEIPLHDTVQLVTTGTDTITDLDVQVDWQDDCLAAVTIAFSADPVFVSKCCDTWDPVCLVPCETVIGEQSSPDGDGWYVVDDAQQIVERSGGSFGEPIDCDSGLVEGSGEYPDSYFDGEMWVAVADFEVSFNICTNIHLEGVIMPLYSGSVEVSLNGTDYTSVGTYTQAQLEAGVDMDVPEDITHIRIAVVSGESCILGYSAVQTVECMMVTVTQAGISGVNGAYVRLTTTSWKKGNYFIDWIDEGGGTSYWIMYLSDGGNITYYLNYTAGVFVALEDVATPWSVTGAGVEPLPVVTP
jgi:hypothetical protein